MSWEKNWFALLFLLIMLNACRQDNERNIPDISGISVEVPLRRFEVDLFAIDTHRVAEQLPELEARYPEFGKVFFENVLASKDPRVAPEGHVAYVEGFLRHPGVRQLYDTCMTLYPDLDDIHREFEQAFRFLTYYFPQLPTPDLTTFISEYTVGAFIYGEQSLAIGLDFFLGEDYPYRTFNPDNPNFSDYLTRSFNRDHLVSKTLVALIDDLAGPPSGSRLLDLMVHNGKKLYILDHLLPFAPDSVKLEVAETQVDWLADNELEMWAYFLKEDLLYSTAWQEIRKYVEYSPHSPGMPDEAPGRTANWLGWQIVKAYMRQFPQTTLPELIALSDAQEILTRSRYKPRRKG